MTILIWLIIAIVLLIFEALTVGLTSIWFAAGALAAMIACALGLGTVGQVIVFFAVSLVLLIFTRPFALKYVNPHRTRTNYEDAVDKKVRITETVDNNKATGTAVLNGQEWTARMQQDDIILPEGSFGIVVKVEGVKLILVPAEEKE